MLRWSMAHRGAIVADLRARDRQHRAAVHGDRQELRARRRSIGVPGQRVRTPEGSGLAATLTVLERVAGRSAPLPGSHRHADHRRRRGGGMNSRWAAAERRRRQLRVRSSSSWCRPRTASGVAAGLDGPGARACCSAIRTTCGPACSRRRTGRRRRRRRPVLDRRSRSGEARRVLRRAAGEDAARCRTRWTRTPRSSSASRSCASRSTASGPPISACACRTSRRR